MIGKIILFFMLFTSLTASITYLLSSSKLPNLLKTARINFWGTTLGFVFVSLFLAGNILVHNFSFYYIWNYSSTDLPFFLLLSTFYAGQEGSFLLWALLLSIIGIAFYPYAKKHGYENHALGIYSAILFFLVLILVIKSPFNRIWDMMPGNGFSNSSPPAEGRGLNPVLQNYWIAIHPPILFTGYAMTTIAYVLGLSALIKRDYKNWIKIATPWLLAGTGILGLGIMLGGFWAYETLGWGGFWGWDPVENSSLIPWLLSVSFVHTALIQKSTGGLQKTNLFLSIITFVVVLYATFLTRSGILGDTSVHSFVDPGAVVYGLLLVFLILGFLLGLTFLIIRIREIPKTTLSFKLTSKEFVITLGAAILLAAALVIFVGTSMPVFADIFKFKKAGIEAAFYNKWMLPMTWLILVLNSFSIYLYWRKNADISVFVKKFSLILLMALAATVMISAFGMKDFKMSMICFGSLLVLLVNLEQGINIAMTNPKAIGAFVSHFGFAFLILGIIATAGYSDTRQLKLSSGVSADAFGYKFTMNEKKLLSTTAIGNEKYACDITYSNGKDNGKILPLLTWSSFNNYESPFFEPGIKKFIAKDIYLAPKGIDYVQSDTSAKIQPGGIIPVMVDDAVTMKFNDYFLSKHNMTGDSSNSVLAVVVNFFNGGKQSTDTLYSVVNIATGDFRPLWYSVPNSSVKARIAGIEPEENMKSVKVSFVFTREYFIFDITIKPLINFVWGGVLVMVAGFWISVFRYSKKKEN